MGNVFSSTSSEKKEESAAKRHCHKCAEQPARPGSPWQCHSCMQQSSGRPAASDSPCQCCKEQSSVQPAAPGSSCQCCKQQSFVQPAPGSSCQCCKQQSSVQLAAATRSVCQSSGRPACTAAKVAEPHQCRQREQERACENCRILEERLKRSREDLEEQNKEIVDLRKRRKLDQAYIRKLKNKY
ncbi:keratin-associated protein 10-8-like [Nasonia vitripennis]|uniref:Uncharacterized protein n=1 Tax=Nasonia vitripennis TaxID=7425 RepID=A0A7M7Q2B5_NASVI|nr:keratin-associated protein 10-8-like [Nasonia vitripennis]